MKNATLEFIDAIVAGQSAAACALGLPHASCAPTVYGAFYSAVWLCAINLHVRTLFFDFADISEVVTVSLQYSY